jgi:hypothetical protein
MEPSETTNKSFTAKSGPVASRREAVQEGMFGVFVSSVGEPRHDRDRFPRALTRERTKPIMERPASMSFSTDLQAALKDPLGDESNACAKAAITPT